ncbi:Uncharacterized protein TCM_007283 [Theobroma cacao]|uniref:Zinc knuckle CX2CX4HX4C domain-containing protein n=1 Tax=Theobroma cacao TaxID=3641 RepID=A0A061E0Q7_THECC|nr:Uncharacterized protein TCM_007283 [Theobroma cacao]
MEAKFQALYYFLRFDYNLDQGKFVRICVEIDHAKPLIPKIKIGDSMQKVEYKAIYIVWFQCGVIRHRMDNCPLQNVGVDNKYLSGDRIAAKKRGPTIIEAAKVNGDTCNTINYGSWMMVQKKS